MKPKDVMKKALTALATHCATMAKAHQTSADDYEDGCSESVYHKAAAASHLATGEEMVSCCQECMKVSDADFAKAESLGLDWDSLIPTAVSGITPDVPANVRAVPRYGQRDFSAESRKTNVGTPIDAASLVQKITQIEE
jgi:hypothetical protein